MNSNFIRIDKERDMKKNSRIFLFGALILVLLGAACAPTNSIPTTVGETSLPSETEMVGTEAVTATTTTGAETVTATTTTGTEAAGTGTVTATTTTGTQTVTVTGTQTASIPNTGGTPSVLL